MLQKVKSPTDRTRYVCAWIILSVSIIVSIPCLWQFLYVGTDEGWNHGGILCCYDDFLYNYANGFIRRGLSGEILIFTTRYLHFHPVLTIVLAIFISFLAVGWLLYKGCRARRISPVILLVSFTMGSVLILGFVETRRDYIELLLFAVALLAYGRLSRKVWIVLANLLMVTAILLHEATFFFTVPVLVLVENVRTRNLLKSILCFSPSIVAFLACCYFKGTADYLAPIVARAEDWLLDGYTGDKSKSHLLSFIGADPRATMQAHLEYNFTGISESKYTGITLPNALTAGIYIVYVAYMTVALVQAFTRRKIAAAELRGLVGMIVVQFICLIPMFTVLSCDMGRVISYWTLSALMVWLFLPVKTVCAAVPAFLRGVSEKLMRFCVRFRIPLPWLTVLVLCFGIPKYAVHSVDVIGWSSLLFHLYASVKTFYIPLAAGVL